MGMGLVCAKLSPAGGCVSGSRKESKTLLNLRITLEQAPWGLLRPGIRLLSPTKLFQIPLWGMLGILETVLDHMKEC